MITPDRLTHKDRLIFYLHGGAYVCGPNRFHWPMLADLCRRTGMAVSVIRYGLAPEHPFPGSINDAMTAYRYFQNRYADICILGDSAVSSACAAGHGSTDPPLSHLRRVAGHVSCEARKIMARFIAAPDPIAAGAAP